MARWARAGDAAGLVDHLETQQRERLRGEEERERAQRRAAGEAAIARGEQPPADERDLPWSALSKKARRRARQRLMSDSDSIRIVASLPLDVWFDALQSFASLGQTEGADYILRRMEQVGVLDGLDAAQVEQLALKWIEGITQQAVEVRKQHAEQVLQSEAAAQQMRDAEQQQAQAQQLEDGAAQEEQPPQPSSDSSLATTSSSLASSNPLPSALADPAQLSAGLPCSGRVRASLSGVFDFLQRWLPTRPGRPHGARAAPTLHIVRASMEALALDNDVHGALALVARLHKMRYHVTGLTYALIIHALAKHQNSEGCMFVFLQMEKAKFTPNVQTFNALISAFARVGDYRTAYRLLRDMQRSGLPGAQMADSRTFAAIVEACCRAGKMELAIEMVDYLNKNYAKLPGVNIQQQQHQIQDGRNAEQQQGEHAGEEQQHSSSTGEVVASSQSSLHQKLSPALGAHTYGVLINEYLRLNQLPQAIVSRMLHCMQACVCPLLLCSLSSFHSSPVHFSALSLF